jgi:hypothetical protein
MPYLDVLAVDPADDRDRRLAIESPCLISRPLLIEKDRSLKEYKKIDSVNI